MREKKLDPKEYFYCRNGVVFKDLNDFKLELEKNSRGIDMETFEFHVNNNGNDFANWIRDVFMIPELSEKMRSTKTPSGKLKILSDFLKKDSEKSDVDAHEKKEQEKTIEIQHDEVRDEVHKEDHDEENFDSESIQESKWPDVSGLKPNIERFMKKSDEELEKIKMMKQKIFKPSQEFAKEIESAEEEYSQLYSEVSDSRKEGMDVFIPALKLRNIKPKINYMKLSKNAEDYKKIKKILEDVRLELKECQNYKAPDLKAEIMEKAKEQDTQNKETEKVEAE